MKNVFKWLVAVFVTAVLVGGFHGCIYAQMPLGSSDSTKTNVIAGSLQVNKGLRFKHYKNAADTSYQFNIDANGNPFFGPRVSKWNDISGKPSTFPPSTHTHSESDITNLVTDLAGKASLSHSHAQSDIVGLSSALAAKQNTITTGTSSQYFKGDFTLGTFQTDVRAQFTNGTGIGISSGTISNTGVTSVNGSTGAVTGLLTTSNLSGTSGYYSKFSGTNTAGNGQLYDYGSGVGINTTVNAGYRLDVSGTSRFSGLSYFDTDVRFSRDNFNSATNTIRGTQWITLSEDNFTGMAFVSRSANGDDNGFLFRTGANGSTEANTKKIFQLFQRASTSRLYASLAASTTISMDNATDKILTLRGTSGINYADVELGFVSSFSISQADIKAEDQEGSNKQMLSFWTNDGSSSTSLTRKMTIDGDGRIGIGCGSKTADASGGWTGVTARLHVKHSVGYNQLRLETSYTPSSSSDTNGNTGDVAWDDNYIYVKTSAGWKRTSLSSF